MNSAFVQEQAKTLAEQVANEAAAEAKVQQLYRRVFSRNATAFEVSLGVPSSQARHPPRSGAKAA
jgi:hypothetical protein